MNKSKKIIMVGVSLFIILPIVYIWQEESTFLKDTDRYENPTMLYSSELQKKFLVDANFVSNPFSIVRKNQVKCFRPYVKVRHNNVELSDHEYNSCNTDIQSNFWKGFGEEIVVKEKYALITKDPNIPHSNNYELCYRKANTDQGCNRILNNNLVTLNIRFNNSQKAISLTDLNNEKQDLTLINKAIRSDNRNDNVKVVKIAKATTEEKKHEDAFTIEKITGRHQVQITDKINKNENNVKIFDCTNNSSENKDRRFVYKVQGLSAKIEFWCNSNAVQPKTEVERLAYQVNSFPVKSLHNTTITSTIDKEANAKLKKLTGRGKALLMNQNGEILAMVSNDNDYDYENDFSTIDNFKNTNPGSIVKPIFAHAILSTIPELATLKMKINPADCRRLVDNKSIDSKTGCVADQGFYNDTNGHTGLFDFTRFISKSDNVYASTLLYLGSTNQMEKPSNNVSAKKRWLQTVTKKANCNEVTSNDPKQIDITKDKGITSINGKNVQCWLKTRAGTFKEGDNVSVQETELNPQWYKYLTEHELIYTPENPSYRFFDKFSFTYPNTNKSMIIDPDTVFNQKYTESAFKWARGGGDSRWSTVGIAENITSIVTKKYIKAKLHSINQDTPKPFNNNDTKTASDVVIDGMKAVICSEGGTAKTLIKGLSCDKGVPTFKRGSNNIVVLAKTGTSNKIYVPEKPYGKGLSWKKAFINELSDITEFKNNNFYPLDDWCKDESCEQLSEQGNSILNILQDRFNNKTYNFNNSQSVEKHFMNWLTCHHNLNPTKCDALQESKQPLGEGKKVKRMVLSFATNSDNSINGNNFDKVCTFVFIGNRGASNITFSKRVIYDMKQTNSPLAKACGFRN